MSNKNSSKIRRFTEVITTDDKPVKQKTSLSSDDFRSQEVQDIISERPGFWGTWALPVFLIILLLIIGGTWFIRYPDTIKASAVLGATNGPRAIVTRNEGKLVRLFVHSGDTIEQGASIGWVESTGNHSQVLQLAQSLDSAIFFLKNDHPESVSHLFQSTFNNLGELQPAYQEFMNALQQFLDYLATGYFYDKKRTLIADITYLRKNKESIVHQLKLTRKDLELATKNYQANKKLYREKVISALKYRNARSAFLNKQQAIPQLEQALTNNLYQQADKRSEIAELQHTVSQQKNIFVQTLHTLKSKVDQWITQYVIKAPVPGTVIFLLPLQENRFIRANETLGYVNPLHSTYYARVQFSQQNFGKAEVGQEVQLRLNAYPYQQFGILKGRLSYISSVASDSGFLGRVVLPNGLKTEYGKTIQFRSGLRANAIIITEPMRLLQKFYYNMTRKLNR